MSEQIYETIVVAAEHAQLKKVHDVFAVEDTVNALYCQFEFRSEEWQNMTKTAVFIHEAHNNSSQIDSSSAIHVLLDDTNMCIVPYEILKDHGSFCVGVFGIDGDSVLPTNLIKFKCNIGCYSDGTEPEDPTQSIYEQIISSLNKKQDKLIAGENIIIEDNTISSSIPDEFKDKNFIYIQSSASDVWVIQHTLNKYPAVSIVDSAGSIVIGEVKYDSLSQITITFNSAFSGKAFLN